MPAKLNPRRSAIPPTVAHTVAVARGDQGDRKGHAVPFSAPLMASGPVQEERRPRGGPKMKTAEGLIKFVFV